MGKIEYVNINNIFNNIYFWNHGKKRIIWVIPPGQFFRLKRKYSVEKIARKGILRKFLFGKFGFGEFIIHNWPKEEKK
ncbi:MAG: hypothetical protein ACTSRG_26555 [Candidatus Helarchaeota archaeon]